MRFVAIEFDNRVNNTHTIGYLRIPDNFNPNWPWGFIAYLRDKYRIFEDVQIYPLNISLTSDTMGKSLPGYQNMEDDFNLALRSIKYYPNDDDGQSIRRQWASMDPASPDFEAKHR